MSRFGIRLGIALFFFCTLSLETFAKGGKPPPPPPKNPPPQGGGQGYSPPPPPVFPTFPQPAGGGQQGGGGGEPEHPPIVSSPPPAPPKPPEEFKIKEKKPVVVKPPHRRHPLFITNIEKVYRSNVFFREIEDRRDTLPGLNEGILALETALRESENDVLASKHEYESDLLKLETTKQLHDMHERLYAKKALTKQAYEESLAKLKKITNRVDESRARWKEFEAEVTINQWKLAQAKGNPVALLDKAKSYLALWEARLDKVKAAEGQAKAEYEYCAIVFDMAERLYKAQASSKEELINARKELDEATVVWKLAKTLIENNTKFVEEARQTVQMAERGEAVPL